MYVPGKIGIITQVRMTSTRLPGKVLMLAGGKSLLAHHIDRLKQTGLPIIIATTENATDNSVQEFAVQNGLVCFRGSEENVLSRFYYAAIENHLDTIIRVTSDCPFIDPGLILQGIEVYNMKADENLYVSNCHQRTYARGFDFELFSFKSIKDAFENANEQADLEHVTPYIWKNKSGKISLAHIKQERDCSHFRVTVDTPEDFSLIKELIEKYHAETLSCRAIEDILLEHPELVKINSHIEQKKVN